MLTMSYMKDLLETEITATTRQDSRPSAWCYKSELLNLLLGTDPAREQATGPLSPRGVGFKATEYRIQAWQDLYTLVQWWG